MFSLRNRFFLRRILPALLAAPFCAFAQGSDPAGELSQTAAGPEVWGHLGQKLYATGERRAPNGALFDPLFMADLDFNLGILPKKKLYLFGQNEFWAQRSAPSLNGNDDEGFSKREYNVDLGFAWNPFGWLELRASAFALNNINRGLSRTQPFGYNDGTTLEGRYYFGSANIYDTGRLSFVSVGYHPSKALIGGDGTEFRPGFFARGYITYDIPGLRSYLFGDLELIGEEMDSLRLISFDGGLAIRPSGTLQNLEFRVGNELTADLEAETTRNLVYGAVRAYFGGGTDQATKERDASVDTLSSSAGPEIWGNTALRFYATGERIAPNGFPFDPLFTLKLDFNLGLLPQKKIYLFVQDEFWGQRAAPGITNDAQGDFDFSKREFDVDVGIAWNVWSRLELRGSVYALNNLNRGITTDRSSGYKDGTKLEARYYFESENIYDTARLSFISLGYHPSQNMVGGDGEEFRPGLFARGRAAYNLPALRSYLYGEATLVGEDSVNLRLLTVDAGLGIRPFRTLQNLEFRVGNEFTADIEADTTRDLVYGAIQINFSNR